MQVGVCSLGFGVLALGFGVWALPGVWGLEFGSGYAGCGGGSWHKRFDGHDRRFSKLKFRHISQNSSTTGLVSDSIFDK